MSECKHIKSIFTDERGEIYDIFVNEPKEHCALVTFNKGSIRGNHFHKKSIQYAFILDGIFKVYDTTVNESGEFNTKNVKVYEAKKNFYISHGAYEAHAYTCLSNSGSMVVFTTGVRGGKYYEDDTYRLKKKLID